MLKQVAPSLPGRWPLLVPSASPSRSGDEASRRGSRLSFPATEPPDPRRAPEGFEKGVSEVVSEVVSEGFSKGFRRGPRMIPSKTPLKPLQNPCKTLQRPFQRPPSQTLLGSGGFVAGNESLEKRETCHMFQGRKKSMVMKFHGNFRGKVRVNFLAFFASKPHIFIAVPSNCPELFERMFV